MPKIKPDTTTPAIAAQQAEWHCRQAASHFDDSHSNRSSAGRRATARKRFLTDTRFALPTMGLERFLREFRGWLGNTSLADEGEQIVRQLWAEHLAQQAGAVEPLPVATDARSKLQAARQLLTLIGEQLDAALAMRGAGQSETGGVV